MPATRTRRHRSRQATSPARNRPTPAEVIVISSDDESKKEDQEARFTRTIKKPRLLMEKIKLKETNELLEKQVADQRKQLDNSSNRLEEQVRELIAAELEILNVRHELQEQKEKLAALEAKAKEPCIGATKLGDMLSCGICTELMHSPYMLTDCGHSYCEGCLKGWFSGVIRRPVPEYTCPGCRKEVTRKPVVNYHIKDMVSIVGDALGQPDTGRGGQQAGPFDRFFPL